MPIENAQDPNSLIFAFRDGLTRSWLVGFEQDLLETIEQKYSSQAFSDLAEYCARELTGRPDRLLFGYLAYPEHASQQKLYEIPSLRFQLFRKRELMSGQEFDNFLSACPALPEAERLETLVSDTDYARAIDQVKERIGAGDTYLLNLSRPFRLGWAKKQEKISPVSLFRALLAKNPAQHNGYLRLNENQALCSASPETFLRKQAELVSTYPIKGTRPLTGAGLSREQWAADLLADPKERAEHLMIVDLERNDLGKLSTAGSVRVSRFAQIESTPHLQHLVSVVEGLTGTEAAAIWSFLAALFPSGSVTGAPKTKTMEIIAELEPYARGLYTGALGYVDHRGDGLFSILIRSLFWQGKQAFLNVGGGLVHDSEPNKEIAETYLKLAGSLAALDSKHALGYND